MKAIEEIQPMSEDKVVTAEGTDPAIHPEVKPVGNALRILRLLTRHRTGQTLTQIAGELEINVSTCLAILRTLASSQMVRFDAGTKIYVIGDGLVSLASAVLAASGIEDRFRHSMERIAETFDVTVSLWRAESSDRIRLILSVTSGGNFNIQMRVGQRLPRWVAAAGRVMTAFGHVEDEALRPHFNVLNWHSTVTFDRYLQQLEETRARGYAIDDGEFASGIYSLSVPVWTEGRALSMALSGSMFMGQHDTRHVTALAQELLSIGGRRL